MIDTSTPAPDLDSGLDAEISEPKTLTLTPEQMDSLSLGDPAPGQVFKIELKFSGQDSPDSAPDASPNPAVSPRGENGDLSENAPATGKTFSVVSSTTTTPPDAGSEEAPDDLPPNTPDDDSTPEEKTLGFKRAPKASRAGLPPTINMRSA